MTPASVFENKPPPHVSGATEPVGGGVKLWWVDGVARKVIALNFRLLK
jgi:hypothetical protein